MDEITLTEPGWAWKVQNFTFCHFWQLNIHLIHKHSNKCHTLNFHPKLIVFKCSSQCPLSESIKNEITKTANLKYNDPLINWAISILWGSIEQFQYSEDQFQYWGSIELFQYSEGQLSNLNTEGQFSSFNTLGVNWAISILWGSI